MKFYMFRTVPLSIIRIFSLYTQQWCMSYRFADCQRAGSGWKPQFHPDPARKLSANLYDIYHCCVYSVKTPDNGQRNCPKHVEFHSKNKFEKLVHLVGFIISSKLSANLYDIYHCCVYSEKLLIMDRGTVRNMQSFIPKINLRNYCISWFFISSKLSANLYDIYHCCVYSEKLLMMDRGTVRNMQSLIPKINLRNYCISWFFINSKLSANLYVIPLLCVQ